MLKFFRKYNKQLLVVVTVLLMIVFVGGFALESMLVPDLSSQEIAQAFGKPITQGDLSFVEGQTTILTRLGYPWNFPGGLVSGIEPLEVMDYLLLLFEAGERGFQPDLEQARQQLALRNLDLNSFSLNNRVPTEEIEAAVANYLGVTQLWVLAGNSALPGELEIRQAVRDQHEKINADIVEIKSTPLIDTQEEIPEEILQAHFEKYQEQTVGRDPLDFGYLIPDRVQVQYAVVNTAEIKLTQPVTEKEAESYWRDHQAQFPRPKDGDADALDSGEDQSEQEGPQPPELNASPYYDTFADASDDVLNHLRGQRRLKEARTLANTLWTALREPWYHQPEDEAGFPESPVVAAALDHYQKTVQALEENLAQSECIEFGQTELFSAEESGDQARIGQAREELQGSGRGSRFGQNTQNTHRVQGLVETAQGGDLTGRRALALYQTAPSLLFDQQNNLYLYRVIKVEKHRPPNSLEEVRDQVITDVRAWRAFEAANAHAQAVRDRVGEDGLQAAWDAYDGLDAETKTKCGSFFQANPFHRANAEIFPGFSFPVIVSDQAGARDEQGNLRHQINKEDFVVGVYDLLQAEGGDAVGAIEVPAIESAFVVQLAGLEHLTKADYDGYKEQIRNQIARTRSESLMRAWFSADRIRARCGFDLES